MLLFFFFCNDTATPEIYTYLHTLSLHDALPISEQLVATIRDRQVRRVRGDHGRRAPRCDRGDRPLELARDGLQCSVPCLRSEEHTSELQSLMRISYAVFCLKKKTNIIM